MSIPSSSDAVATRACSSPRFRRSSASNRFSLDRLPWWLVTCSAPIRSESCIAIRSARRRVFTNTSVVRCCEISSTMRLLTSSHTSADITASSGDDGISSARSSVRMWPASTIVGCGCPVPTRNCAISSIGRCVADSPIRCGRLPISASSRARVRARWLPRLSRATAWISSTITVRTDRSISRARSDVRIR